MAITKIGPPLAGIRGTLGGVVYSANGSGTYCKPWAPPSNPRTELQMVERSYLASMPALWQALSSAQRTAWDTFAALGAQALVNSLGETYYASGYNWFVKCNIRLLRVGRATISAAPTIPRPAAPTITGLNVTQAGTDTEISIGGTVIFSTEKVGAEAVNAFDDDLGTYWRTTDGILTGYIGKTLAVPAICRRYDIYISTALYGQNPKAWSFQGWTGAAWVNLHSVTAWSSTPIGWHIFRFPNETSYSDYRLLILSIYDPGETNVLLTELKFWAGDKEGTCICFAQGDFHTVAYDLILHVSPSISTARAVQYPGYLEILASQGPGRWYVDAQTPFQARFGIVQSDRRWFARLYRQTSEGIRSAAATTASDTIESAYSPPILDLPMDDDAATPTVVDVSAGHHDQTFLDPGGDPNTDAHSVPGVVGTALAFDGVDDAINLGATIDAALGAGQDFALAFWWARGDGNDENYKYLFYKAADNGQLFAVNSFNVPSQQYTTFYVYRSISPEDRVTFTVLLVGYGWNHYVFQRRGDTVELWANGALVDEDTTVGNDRDFSGVSGFELGGTGANHALGSMDDFRVYDRALLQSEIEALATAP